MEKERKKCTFGVSYKSLNQVVWKIIKKILLFLSVLLCTSIFSQKEQSYHVVDIDNQKNIQIGFDTTKYCFLLDSKRVSVTDIIKGHMNETIEWHYGINSTRQILLKFGEKYRNYNELTMFVTRKKDEENN